MHIAVTGRGYVGIPAVALFADVDGFKVTGGQRRSKWLDPVAAAGLVYRGVGKGESKINQTGK